MERIKEILDKFQYEAVNTCVEEPDYTNSLNKTLEEITTYIIGEVSKLKKDIYYDREYNNGYVKALDNVIELLKGEK